MWWAIIRTPDGLSLWPAGEKEVENSLVLAARVLTGFPVDSSWVDGDTGYDIGISQGDQHPSLVAEAKRIGTAEELRKVAQADVDQHEADMLAASAAEREETAKQALAALDETARARLVADVVVAVEEVPGVRPLV